MKLALGEQRRRKPKSKDLQGEAQAEKLFDPRIDVHPELVSVMRQEVEKLSTALVGMGGRLDEILPVLEAWQYIHPEEMPEFLKKFDSDWSKLLHTLSLGDARGNLTQDFINQLFISLSRLFPERSQELRRKFVPPNQYIRGDAYNPHNWVQLVDLTQGMVLSLMDPEERLRFKESVVFHTEDINRRLETLRQRAEWPTFSGLLANVLLLAPELKPQLDVKPTDVEELKAVLRNPSEEGLHSTRLAQLVIGLVYYTSPRVQMSPAGKVTMERRPAPLSQSRPLPDRQV